MELTAEILKELLAYQRSEITEYHIYNKLAGRVKSPANAKILRGIASDEFDHYQEWKAHTGVDVRPNWLKVWRYYLISIIFGYTFAIKLMENGEDSAQSKYEQVVGTLPEAARIIKDENDHEEALIAMLDEERLRYTGSMVLGLNDALVELTGALAGLTLALQDTALIALTGSITGVAAAFSMAASEYLATKAEGGDNHPVKASIYTGIAYICTVIILITPFLVCQSYILAITLTLISAILIIAGFNYYISVAKDLDFKSRFLEMAGLSMGVALLSFGMGFAIRYFLGVEI